MRNLSPSFSFYLSLSLSLSLSDFIVISPRIKLKIESQDGIVTLHIDGKKHGPINGCNPAKGFIALQSEGSEIHFKNITMKELPATKPVKKKKKQ